MSSTQYRYVGNHAEILESGQPVAPGDYVTIDDDDMSGINGMLLNDGNLIDATGITPSEMEAEVETAPIRNDPKGKPGTTTRAKEKE